jgi:hypothetical protein
MTAVWIMLTMVSVRTAMRGVLLSPRTLIRTFEEFRSILPNKQTAFNSSEIRSDRMCVPPQQHDCNKGNQCKAIRIG